MHLWQYTRLASLTKRLHFANDTHLMTVFIIICLSTYKKVACLTYSNHVLYSLIIIVGITKVVNFSDWIFERQKRSTFHGRVVDHARRCSIQSRRNSSRAYRQKEGRNQVQKGQSCYSINCLSNTIIKC